MCIRDRLYMWSLSAGEWSAWRQNSGCWSYSYWISASRADSHQGSVFHTGVPYRSQWYYDWSCGTDLSQNWHNGKKGLLTAWKQRVSFHDLLWWWRHTLLSVYGTIGSWIRPVSYTHLDVYKRQAFICSIYDHDAFKPFQWRSYHLEL